MSDITVPQTPLDPINKNLNIIEDGRQKALTSNSATVNFDMLKVAQAPVYEDDIVNFGNMNTKLKELGSRVTGGSWNGVPEFYTVSGLAKADALSTCYGTLGVLLDNAGTVKFSRGGKLIGGFTGLTVGMPMFLSTDTAGGYTQTCPSAAGYFIAHLGYATSATEMEFDPKPAVEILVPDLVNAMQALDLYTANPTVRLKTVKDSAANLQSLATDLLQAAQYVIAAGTTGAYACRQLYAVTPSNLSFEVVSDIASEFDTSTPLQLAGRVVVTGPSDSNQAYGIYNSNNNVTFDEISDGVYALTTITNILPLAAMVSTSAWATVDEATTLYNANHALSINTISDTPAAVAASTNAILSTGGTVTAYGESTGPEASTLAAFTKAINYSVLDLVAALVASTGLNEATNVTMSSAGNISQVITVAAATNSGYTYLSLDADNYLSGTNTINGLRSGDFLNLSCSFAFNNSPELSVDDVLTTGQWFFNSSSSVLTWWASSATTVSLTLTNISGVSMYNNAILADKAAALQMWI